jgi:hypothetical protein
VFYNCGGFVCLNIRIEAGTFGIKINKLHGERGKRLGRPPHINQGHCGTDQGHCGTDQGHCGTDQGHCDTDQGHCGTDQGHWY